MAIHATALSTTRVPPVNDKTWLTIYSRAAAHLAAIAHRISRSIFLPLVHDLQIIKPDLTMSEFRPLRLLSGLKAGTATAKIRNTKVCVQVFEEDHSGTPPKLENEEFNYGVFIFVSQSTHTVYIASKTGSQPVPSYSSEYTIKDVLTELLSGLEDYEKAKRFERGSFIYKLSMV